MMSEKDTENIDEKEKFDDDLISTETLHDIRDGNQTHPSIASDLYKRNHYSRIRDFAGIDQFRRNWFRSVPFHTRA